MANTYFSSTRAFLWKYPSAVGYGGAVLAVWLALSLWTLTPVLHREPFTFFLVAVVVTARFLGFGPALICTILSTLCLDYIVLPPQFALSMASSDLERLAVFLGITTLVSSLARQKTIAVGRAERTTTEIAAIAEGSEDAIFSTSPDGIILSWNRGAERLYGYSAEEAVGAHVETLSPPERQRETIRNRQLLLEGIRVDGYETERMRKDGTRVPIALTVSPLRNRRGEVVGASAVARDLSGQRQSEEAIRRSEKLATAGRLAASVAHEINNPLEAILNLLYLARHDREKADEYLAMAEGEVNRVARLAQQTLGLVRENNTVTLIDPARLLDEVVLLYSHKIDSKKIRLTRRYRSKCEVPGYSGEVRQLLANLLVNAVDAMPTGGILHLRVEASREWKNGRSGARITVADNGVGIPRQEVGRIFDPFFSTKSDAGTGLGLWVSRGIAEKHGGRIRVRSRTENGRSGTVFSVFLPCTEDVSKVA